MTEQKKDKWDVDYQVNDPMTPEEREVFKKMSAEEKVMFLQLIKARVLNQ